MMMGTGSRGPMYPKIPHILHSPALESSRGLYARVFRSYFFLRSRTQPSLTT